MLGCCIKGTQLAENRKLAAILVADIVGYSRLAGADEDRILARLRTLRSDLIEPTIAVHNGRIVKGTGDGSIVEFRSVVDAVRCAIEMQNGMRERNAGVPEDRQILFRVGIHLGDVVEERDGDLMGDGVNIAARLEAIAEAGGVCISEDAFRQVRDRMKEEFIDLGQKPLKNIARPVGVFAVKTDSAVPAPRASAEAKATPRLSVVVLPFANIGADAEQDYFVDGVTESLTTDLSRIAGSFVIARNTAFTYKGKAIDVTKIGRELNIRYALEGSVQRGGNRMRVNVQLIDAQSGSHLWAERFEKPVTDLFEMQDEIVARLANTLNAQLVAVEARRADRVPTPDSMDLYFQGMALLNRGISPENATTALGLFERALALDPTNVEALVGKGLVDVNAAVASSSDDRAARFAAAEKAASEALSAAPDHPQAHLCLGMVLAFTNRAAQAIAEFERALALDRNLTGAHALIGQSKLFMGRGEETEAHVQESLRLSPRDPWTYTRYLIVGLAKCVLGRPDEAVSWLRQSIEANRNYSLTHFTLAGTLAGLDRIEEARSEMAAGLALDRQFSIASFRATSWSDHPVYLRQLATLIDGLRKAGAPEG
jgi:TolB-like protein/alkanesulfonate monooxygenase SsuD/methylene tetrahydromethanopterin reductase-like flavin-dependent oxidoreductase (luciferase family)